MEGQLTILICGTVLIVAVSPIIAYGAYESTHKTIYLEFSIGGGAGWFVAPLLFLSALWILNWYDFGGVYPRDSILPTIYFLLGPILGAFFGMLIAIGGNLVGKRRILVPCICGGALSGFGMGFIGAYPFMA